MIYTFAEIGRREQRKKKVISSLSKKRYVVFIYIITADQILSQCKLIFKNNDDLFDTLGHLREIMIITSI